MTTLTQLKTAFPDHLQRILAAMDPVWRSAYLVREAKGGAASALRGAFIWERSQEGHAFWATLAREAQ